MDKDAEGTGKQPLDRDPVFYYSRARRLERASEAVRAMNEPGPPKRIKGFRALTASKPQGFLLMSVILLAVVLVILSGVLSREDTSTMLGGNAVAASALGFEGTTYVTIKKTVKQEDRAYTGTVDLAVSEALPPGEESGGRELPISTHRIFFSLEPEEEYRFSVPFEASRLLILMRAGEELVRLSVQSE
jgi:hypothetical protein